jgi:hypothetical protein
METTAEYQKFHLTRRAKQVHDGIIAKSVSLNALPDHGQHQTRLREHLPSHPKSQPPRHA